VAEAPPDGLMIDLTGCAHLFGGEEALFAQVEADCTDLGLTVRAGIADTAGAAWALARFSGTAATGPARSGDAIDQEARATRSRAGKRHWTKGGAAPPTPPAPDTPGHRIAKPGNTRQAIAPLPVAALRIKPETAEGLARLGLRRIGDVLGMPRAGLARRFGADFVRRLDQALGVEPEPITPAAAPLHFAVRLSLPEPIGLEADILAGLDRLAPVLCDKLRAQGRGARRVRLELSRVDGDTQGIEVGLARPADRPDQLRPLFALKTGDIDAGFGIDRLRLSAPLTEPLHATEHKGGWAVSAEATGARGEDQAMADLIARIGARVGLEAITRARPADSHIPEKTATPLAAAWSERATDWPRAPRARPLMLFPPRTPAGGGLRRHPRQLHLARPQPHDLRRHRPRTHRAGMVARRSRLALGRARLLARDDRGWHDALALLCPWQRRPGRHQRRLVRPWRFRMRDHDANTRIQSAGPG
jgi:protein ImuB